MSDLALPLYADLETGKLVTAEGSAFTLPDARLGDTWVCSLRFLTHNKDAVVVERDLKVTGLKASIGGTLAPPTEGAFKLNVDGTITAAIAFDATAATVLTALGAAGVAVSKPANGCWLATLTQGAEALPLAAAADTEAGYNTLGPQSFVRVRAFQRNATWLHEIRLIQTPLAFVDASDRILPEAPSIVRVAAGVAATNDAPATNEIQKLKVPADFRGTYFLHWNSRRSTILGTAAGPDAIAAALNAMFSDGGTRFEVTNPEFGFAYIEFVGALAGEPQELITKTVNTFEPGILTFRLPLGETPMADALRAVAALTAPFEIEIEYIGDSEDPEDEGVASKTLTLCQQEVVCVREQIFSELATYPRPNWLRPPSARNYRARSIDSILTGTGQWFEGAFGDGVLLEYSIAHNLGSDAITSVTVIENTPGGRVLGSTEYTIEVASEDEIIITVATAPTTNALRIIIGTAGPTSAYLAHTHPIDDIDGLREELDAINARLVAVEDLAPNLSVPDDSTTATDREIALDPFEEILPLRAGQALNLAHPPALLPAIHDVTSITITSSTNASPAVLTTAAAHKLTTGEKVTIAGVTGTGATVLNGSSRTVTVLTATTFSAGINTTGAGTGGTAIPELTSPLPAASARTGSVQVNKTGAEFLVPGGSGRASFYLEADGFIASDGRYWYRAKREGSTTSYFPQDFERTFFTLPVNSAQWAAGELFQLTFDLQLQTLAANTTAQYLLVIEHGAATRETVPATTGVNLKSVAWNATPILTQRVLFTGTKLKHHFGARIRRSVEDAITAEKLLYDAWAAGGSAPAAADFLIRARLIEFDVQDDVSKPKGYVSIRADAINAVFK